MRQRQLDVATYGGMVAKAWNGMVTTAVQPNGFLGFVQGVASGPDAGQPVTAGATSDYGVGAFLRAGTEVAALASATHTGSTTRSGAQRWPTARRP